MCNSSGSHLIFKDLASGFRTGIGREESDEQFIRLDAAALGERISRDHVSQFGGGAENHIGATSERSLDSLLYALR